MTATTAPPSGVADGDRSGGRGLTGDRIQAWCLACGPLFTLVLFGGLLLAGFLPPPPPAQSPVEVAAHYADDPDRIRLGLVLLLLGAGLSGPFVVAIDHRLRRLPGADGSMAVLQVIGGVVGVVAIVVPALIFLTAAYRVERPPEVVAALHDLAWIPFVANVVPFLLQTIAIAVAVLAQPLGSEALPRWLGWFNLWAAFLALPGVLLVFFRTGAFAWDGAIVFWVVATVFGAWFWVMALVLRRALRTETA